MKIIVFRREYRSGQLKRRWDRVPSDIAADVVTVPEKEQRDLAGLLGRHDLDAYDRVVIDLKWFNLRPQVTALARIPRLVIHEFDAFWNFTPAARCYLDFERVYHRLPPFRLICCGAYVRDRFVEQGIDAVAVPKAFDHERIRDHGLERDIPVAFLGTLDAPVYRARREMLRAIGRKLPLTVTRTGSAEEYVATLNRIRFFLSADVGMSEYTAKNFEAMAAGCILVAYRQGRGEEDFLGLRDMENVVLYDDPAEAVAKVESLRARPGDADRIAREGRALALARYTSSDRDRRLFDALRMPIAETGGDRRPYWRRVGARILPRIRRCGG